MEICRHIIHDVGYYSFMRFWRCSMCLRKVEKCFSLESFLCNFHVNFVQVLTWLYNWMKTLMVYLKRVFLPNQILLKQNHSCKQKLETWVSRWVLHSQTDPAHELPDNKQLKWLEYDFARGISIPKGIRFC